MKCKICHNTTTHFFDPQLQHPYQHCHECECIFLENPYHLSDEKEHALYNNHHNSLENEGYVKMFEDFLDFFWEDLTCKKRALDFGSGPTPVLSHLIQKRGTKVDCYDKFYQPEPCYENQSYDFITSTEVFEHLNDPQTILALLSKHLNPKGYIALMTLFHTNDESHFLTWWYRRDPTHITFYTPKTIEILAEKCGLERVKTDHKRIILLKKR